MMEQGKHTPGPLEVVSIKSCDGTCQVPVVRSMGSNFNIARFATGFNDKRYAQAYADAHLFAAAPDLLAALEYMMSWTMRDGTRCGCPAGKNEDEPKGKMPTMHSTACQEARAAIKRAKEEI